MAIDHLDGVASTFQSGAEALHEEFIVMISDEACIGCQSAGFGQAILTAWLQTKWSEFTRDLVIASVMGTSWTGGNSVQAVPVVRSREDAERIVKAATACTMKSRGLSSAVWHAPWFVIEVSTHIGLTNLPKLEAALGATVIPWQITAFRNYLVHPSKKTLYKYAELQAKLGMLGVEPENLLRQYQKPGLPVFTAWVRELQRIANDSTR